jgi:hypothetical protein
LVGTFVLLGDGGMNGQSTYQNAGNEESKTAHDNLPVLESQLEDASA